MSAHAFASLVNGLNLICTASCVLLNEFAAAI